MSLGDIAICVDCVGEAYLKRRIAEEGSVTVCGYCDGDEQPCIGIADLADHIEGAFERHYVRTSDQADEYESMLLRDKESDYDFERHGDPVLDAIADAAKVGEDVAADVVTFLEDRHYDIDAAQIGEECEFDTESHYEWKSPRDHEFAAEWRGIERSLKSESRFFNGEAADFLDRLFADLEGRTTGEGRNVVVTAGPDTQHASFFRARVFQSDDEIDEAMMRPDLHLGPPPGRFARAGRMNANGISMFYGASDKGVALAEVRPPVGSRALVAEFQLTRTVRLLDVSALHSVYVEGSIFDPGYVGQLDLAKFMARLSTRITRPVMPDDEPAEYLITQMIADYLARRPAPALDGILFPSVQSPGDQRNVVLFHHSSRVETLEIPRGTVMSARRSRSTDEGEEDDYWVWEEVPRGARADAERADDDLAVFFGSGDDLVHDRDADERASALRVLTAGITAHHVTGVTFTAQEHHVVRHRMEQRVWRSATLPRDDPEYSDF